MGAECPANHPVLRAASRSREADGRAAPRRAAPHAGAVHGVHRPDAPGRAQPVLDAPVRTCWARCALILASLMQLGLMAAIVGLPSVSPGAADLLRIARLDCAAGSALRGARNATAGRALRKVARRRTDGTEPAPSAVAGDGEEASTQQAALGTDAAQAALATLPLLLPSPPLPMVYTPSAPLLAPPSVTTASPPSEAALEDPLDNSSEFARASGLAPLATASVTPQSTAAAPPEPTSSTTPEATASNTPKATDSITPEATDSSTPKATDSTTPKATASTTPEATDSTTPKATALTTPKATDSTTPKATTSITPEATDSTTPKATDSTTPEATALTRPKFTAAALPEATTSITLEATASITPAARATSSPIPPSGGTGRAYSVPAAAGTLKQIGGGSSGLGLLTTHHNSQLLTGMQLDGQIDVDDMLLGVLVACAVLLVIALLGLVIACSRPHSCVRASASTLYFVASLPAWVALTFAIAVCFVFRTEAESLVRRYWMCLLLTEPKHMGGASSTAWQAASAVYQSITFVAALLTGCNALLLAGLYSASRVVGAGIVASQLLVVVNCGQLLVGGGLCAVAAGLHERSDGSVHADAALLALGVGVIAMSSLGLLASRLHVRCLLRLYSGCATLVTLGLLAFVVGLTMLGSKGIADSSFLAENWHYVREIYPLERKEFVSLLDRHLAKLKIAASILAFVQLLVVVASCILRRALMAPSKERATASERAGLIADDDDTEEDEDDEDGTQVV